MLKLDSVDTGNKNFLNLKDRESAVGVLRGEIHAFRTHWVGDSTVICAPGCKECHDGKSSSFRFRVNIVTNDNGTYVAKIFEQGARVFQTLKALQGPEFDLEKNLIKITRMGSDMKTAYMITPVPNGALNEEKLAVIEKIQLQPLEKQPTTGEATGDGVPF